MAIRGSYRDRQIVNIITVDPAQQLIEGRLKDRGLVQIAPPYPQGAFFVWPKVDEVWSIRRMANIWYLEDRMESPYEENGILTLNPGEGRIASDVIYDKSGNPLLSLPSSPSAIADASEAHDVNPTFSDTEVEAALNALGAKINEVIVALEGLGLLDDS